MVRAKFKVESYETRLDSSAASKGSTTPEELRSVKLSAVYGDSEENKKFFRWTPNGTISIGMLNPEAWKQFPLGAEVYVDFNLIEPPAFTPDAGTFTIGPVSG